MEHQEEIEKTADFEREINKRKQNLEPFSSKMNITDLDEFKASVLNYCKANLVYLKIFLPSPYIKVYTTDEGRIHRSLCTSK